MKSRGMGYRVGAIADLIEANGRSVGAYILESHGSAAEPFAVLVCEIAAHHATRARGLSYLAAADELSLSVGRMQLVDAAAAAAAEVPARRPSRLERLREMVCLRNEGLSLEAIGELFPRHGKPMTKEGVRVALLQAAANGLSVTVARGRTRGRVNLHTQRASVRRDEARSLFLAGKSSSVVAASLGVCGKTLHGYLEGVPGYAEARSAARHAARKSLLSYGEIVALRAQGRTLRTIAAEAGVTVARICQVLREAGSYRPAAITRRRMAYVQACLDRGESPAALARRLRISRSTVYRYRTLAPVVGLASPSQAA